MQEQQRNFDGTDIGNKFIEYFYSTWISNPDILITDHVIKPYSKLKYNSITYEGLDFITSLKMISSEGIGFEECKYEILDSGSRQIYILVTGKIKNNSFTKNFNQSFLLTYSGEKNVRKWTMMNSLLIID